MNTASLTTAAQVIPRTLLDLTLRAAQLPVDVVARAAGQQRNSQWPPAVAFAGFEATLETTIGGWLHDQVLVEKGLLRSEKLSQLRRAAELEAAAEQQREKAVGKFQLVTEDADRAREAAARKAADDTQAAAERKAAAERDIDRRAEEQKAATADAQQRRAKAIDRQERKRALAALDEEAQALRTSEAALRAEEKADDVGDALARSKAKRKSGT